MSAEQLGFVSHLVQVLSPVVDVGGWDVRVASEFERQDAYATMSHWPGQLRATLAVSEEFFASTGTDQVQTLLHELVHCRVFLLHEQVQVVVQSVGLEEDAAALAEGVVTVEVERLVDSLADTFLRMVDVEAVVNAARSAGQRQARSLRAVPAPRTRTAKARPRS